jgi:hypothetical protein
LNWLGDLLDPWRGINGSKESCLNSFLSPTSSNINKESQVQCNSTPHFNGLADSSVYHRVHSSLVETLNIIKTAIQFSFLMKTSQSNACQSNLVLNLLK